jgi:hypothetical protein
MRSLGAAEISKTTTLSFTILACIFVSGLPINGQKEGLPYI